MKVVKALFNGQDIQLIEPIKTKKKTEVLVIFPNDAEIFPRKSKETFKGFR